MAESAKKRQGITVRRLMTVIAGVGCLLGGLTWAPRSRAFWGLSQTFELASYFHPWFALAALVGVFVALIATVLDRRVWRVRSLWLLLPFSVPIAILSFGGAFAYNHMFPVPHSVVEQREQTLRLLVWLHVPVRIALLACFRSVSKWVIIAGLSTAALWLSFGASILSWMQVTSNWL